MKTMPRGIPRWSPAAVVRVIADEDPVSSIGRQRSLWLSFDNVDQRRSFGKISAVEHGLRVASRHDHEHVRTYDTQRAWNPEKNDGIGILKQLRLPAEHSKLLRNARLHVGYQRHPPSTVRRVTTK